nr:uncharacterized protein LOC131764487 [Kogia breviceps]
MSGDARQRPQEARRGGAARGRHRGRPTDPRSFSVRPTERGRETERGAPLTPHRSGEPGTRRPETPAAAGCASMADAARPWRGQRASTGTPGGHPALVVARPRVRRPPQTADNVSQRRLRRLPAPGPLPQKQLITQRPHHSPPLRRGGCWEMKFRALRSLEEATPKGTTTPRMHLPLSCFAFSLLLLPRSFGFPQARISVYRLLFSEPVPLAVPTALCQSARVISNAQSFCLKP